MDQIPHRARSAAKVVHYVCSGGGKIVHERSAVLRYQLWSLLEAVESHCAVFPYLNIIKLYSPAVQKILIIAIKQCQDTELNACNLGC